MLARVHAVDPVVARHHAPGVRLPGSGFERRQVDLAQGALVELRAYSVALELRVVADVVLHGRANLLTLEPRDIGHRHPHGQVRVPGVALEVASIER